jgi:hypothetical protein
LIIPSIAGIPRFSDDPAIKAYILAARLERMARVVEVEIDAQSPKAPHRAELLGAFP